MAVSLLETTAGHSLQKQRLLRAFKDKKLGQGYIFVGPSGIGKKQVALGMVQVLMCERLVTPYNSALKACGQCGSCLRVQGQQHEGLLLLQKQGLQIKLEQVHSLFEFLALQKITPVRAVIIDEAQTLNPQAANALLKILEEPPEDTYFFLTAPSVAGVLPTVLSRVQRIYFQSLTESQLREWVFSQLTHPIFALSLESQNWILKRARGQPGKLKDLVVENESSVRQQAWSLLQGLLMEKDFLTDSEWRESLKDRAHATDLVLQMQALIRDLLGLSVTDSFQDLVWNLDIKQELYTCKNLSANYLSQVAEGLVKMEQGLQGFRDIQLMIEELYVTSRYGLTVD